MKITLMEGNPPIPVVVTLKRDYAWQKGKHTLTYELKCPDDSIESNTVNFEIKYVKPTKLIEV